MSANDPEDGGFLSRWSRRKRELAEQDQPRSAEPAAPPASVPAAPEAAPEQAPEPEMIEPPSLDLVDKDFDIAHWLKQNVPESWKLAALRRAWEGDPAIRDYLDPARDYALDWNTPGGAPGYGPLSESDDVAEMVRKVFGDAPPEPVVADADQNCDTLAHELSSMNENAAADDASQHNALSEGPSSELKGEVAPAEAGNIRLETARLEPGAFAAAQQSPEAGAAPLRVRKRGGGATPL